MTVADQNVTPEMNGEADERAPRWLIGVVVVLGVAFLAMLAIIVIKLMSGEGPMSVRAQAPAAVADKAAASDTGPAMAVDGMGNFTVARPAGASLIESELHGREIMMHFRAADGTDTLIVLNRMTGQESRVTIAP